MRWNVTPRIAVAVAITVPAAALTAFAGLEKVVLFQDGKAVEKNVTTGRREAGWVEIVAGLDAGAAVVLAPAGIRTGQPLAVSDPAPPAVLPQTNASR